MTRADNFMPTPYGPKGARTVGEVGDYRYVIGQEPASRPSRTAQFFAEERFQGRSMVRRRFKSEQLAIAQAERWQNFRRLQQEHPL